MNVAPARPKSNLRCRSAMGAKRTLGNDIIALGAVSACRSDCGPVLVIPERVRNW